MEDLNFQHQVRARAGGTRQRAIVGVVASGNLEVLVERSLPDAECVVDIKTAATGFGAVWSAVIGDFVYLPRNIVYRVIPRTDMAR